MCLRIALVMHVWLLIVSFRCFYASIDQAVRVPPQYPTSSITSPLSKANVIPPSEHVSSYVSTNYFLHYNLAFGSKCLLF